MWWFFERINEYVQNWHYEIYPISDVHYVIQASIDFSTVIPAVLSTSFLLHQILLRRAVLPRCKPLAVRPLWIFLSASFGIMSFWLIRRFPHEAFPLVWIAPTLVIEPLAYTLGFPCILKEMERGKCEFIWSVMVSTLVTGFWWEMWNFWSYPKWIYEIPYVGFWKIFEMPFLGYFGYPFFGLAVFSYTAMILGLFSYIARRL